MATSSRSDSNDYWPVSTFSSLPKSPPFPSFPRHSAHFTHVLLPETFELATSIIPRSIYSFDKHFGPLGQPGVSCHKAYEEYAMLLLPTEYGPVGGMRERAHQNISSVGQGLCLFCSQLSPAPRKYWMYRCPGHIVEGRREGRREGDRQAGCFCPF